MDLRKRRIWGLAGIIIVIAVVLLMFYFKNATVSNDKMFVDTISKINPLGNNREAIQNSLDSLSYAPIVVIMDSQESIDKILSSLSSKEFQLGYRSITTLNSFSGNATKSAISKIGRNTHVARIDYSYLAVSSNQDSTNAINEEASGNSEINLTNTTEEIINVTNITCGYCQYAVNNTCINYTCCSDVDCNMGDKCENNKCIKDECLIRDAEVFVRDRAIPFETLEMGNNYLDGIYKPRKGFGYAVITNKSYFEKIVNSNSLSVDFSDFENYFLILVYTEKTLNNYPEIYNITQIMQGVLIGFFKKGDYKDYPNNGWHIVKVNRSYITPREGLDFYFLEYDEDSHKLGGDDISPVHIAPLKGEYPSSCKNYKIYMNAPYHHYYNCTILGTDYYCSYPSLQWP